MNRHTCLCLVLVTLVLAVSTAAAQPALWGDDIVVADIPPWLVPRKLTSDCDADGDIYVALLCRLTGGGDSVLVWRSATGGHDWSRAYGIGTPSETHISDYEFRAGADSNGIWLYDFVLTDNDSGLRLHRHRPLMQNEAWATICPGDTLTRVSADLNWESVQHLFAAWSTDAGHTYVAGSSDSGENWGNRRLVFTQSQDPSVCAGEAATST